MFPGQELSVFMTSIACAHISGLDFYHCSLSPRRTFLQSVLGTLSLSALNYLTNSECPHFPEKCPWIKIFPTTQDMPELITKQDCRALQRCGELTGNDSGTSRARAHLPCCPCAGRRGLAPPAFPERLTQLFHRL